MKFFSFRTTLIFVLSGMLFAGHIQDVSAAKKDLWQLISPGGSDASARSSIALAPDKYVRLRLDEPMMRSELSAAPAPENRLGATASGVASLLLPLPGGEMIDLVFEETAIMAAELAAKYPSIKAYVAYSASQPSISGRLDFTEQGFHAMLSTEQGIVMIDPRMDGNGSRIYISYYKHDYHPLDKAAMSCATSGEHPSGSEQPLFGLPAYSLPAPAARSGSQLTTYRLAVAATGEYTQFQGGTVSAALSAIATTINRVNSIYERDLAISLQLVNNNNSIIYTDAATDPYSNTDASAMLTQNQSNIDAIIGSANYDIGHIVSTGGGGLAQLRVPCGSSKAQGVTGSSQPVGDPFDIDYVAHEIGHQFGGNHTFNATTGSCGGGNRNASTAWEPGSGSTIMAYAGICGGEDLQPNSDSLFHGGSIAELITFITGGGSSCGLRAAIGNAAPIANAGSDYTIPASTPFVLTGSATDSNGDTLTYAWDEIDLGTASTPDDMADQGTRPLYRSFVPSASAVRYFPKLPSILANTSDIGEHLPTTSRSLKFRLTVRDQRGGVADDDVQLTVSAGAGPFQITAPNGGETLSSNATVTWNVANTSNAPVSCASVAISMSTDSGATFPVTLLSSAPNNGSAAVSFPAGSSSAARLKVQCANNIFFDISDNNFSYNSSASTTYTLTVNSSGASGVAIAALPTTYSGSSNYSKTGITAGTSLTLSAPSTAGSATFSAWSGCDAASGVTCSLTLNAARSVTAAYSVSLLSQSIAFGAAPSISVGGTGSVSATASSGLAVTFSSTTTAICTVAGSTVTGVAAGTCAIAANQAGNGSYSAAPPVTQSFTVAASIDDGFPGGGNLPAGWIQPSAANAAWIVTGSTAYAGSQSLRSGIVGNNQVSEISYTANFAAGNVGFARKVSSEADYDFLEFVIDGVLKESWSGEAAWAVVSYPLAAGTHTLLWRYVKDVSDFSGSDAAWIDSVLLPGTASPASQSISFGTAPSVTVGSTASVSATASSGLAVTFSSTTTSICTVSGNTVTGIAAGTCTVAANQAGNASYSAAAQATQSFNVVAPTTYTLTVNSSGASGVAIAASPTTYSGTSNYSKTGITAGTSLTLSAPSTAGSATFSAWSGCDAVSGVICFLTLNAARSVTAAYRASLLSQSIAFGSAPSISVGGTGSVSATASSALPVTFSSLTTSICTVSGSTVTGVAAGTCTVAADQAGDASYSPATQVTQSFGIATGLYTQTVEKLYVAYFGRPGNPSGLTYWTDELAAGNGSSVILQNMFTAFYLSAEYISLHAGQTTEQLVNSLYQYLFGRTAEPAGVNYWVQQIQSGTVTLDRVAYTLVNAASDKPGGNQDLSVLNNKVSAATTFTAHVDTTAEMARYKGTPAYDSARNFIGTVKTSVPSDAEIDAAILSLP